MNLSSMKAAAMAATPGPWTVVRHTCSRDGSYTASDDWSVKDRNGDAVCIEGNLREGGAVGDPEFIAAFNPQAALALLAVVEKLARGYGAWVDVGGEVVFENEPQLAAFVSRIRADAMEEAAKISESLIDAKEEARADARVREVLGRIDCNEDDELARLRHLTDIQLYNGAFKKAAARIRSAGCSTSTPDSSVRAK